MLHVLSSASQYIAVMDESMSLYIVQLSLINATSQKPCLALFCARNLVAINEYCSDLLGIWNCLPAYAVKKLYNDADT
jgi:hypothetical protein